MGILVEGCLAVPFIEDCFAALMDLDCFAILLDGGCFVVPLNDDCFAIALADCLAVPFVDDCLKAPIDEDCLAVPLDEDCLTAPINEDCLASQFDDCLVAGPIEIDCLAAPSDEDCIAAPLGDSPLFFPSFREVGLSIAQSKALLRLVCLLLLELVPSRLFSPSFPSRFSSFLLPDADGWSSFLAGPDDGGRPVDDRSSLEGDLRKEANPSCLELLFNANWNRFSVFAEVWRQSRVTGRCL